MNKKENLSIELDYTSKKQSTYLDITLDLVFKVYLTKHKELLSSFLKAFLPISQEIQSVDILNIDSSIHPNIVEEKQIVLDLRLQLNTGERINVEMQSISKKDFLPRILFYWAKLYTGDLHRGESYKKLFPAYSLVCTKFDVFKETKEWCNSFAILSEKPPHWYFSDHLKIVFVELTKFHKVAIKDLLDLKEQWCYLINRSRHMTPSEMEELSRASKEMKMASEHLKTLSLDRELRFQEEMREKYLRDRIAEEEFSREEGLKEGIEKGLKEGVEKGLKEGVEKGLKEGVEKGLKEGIEKGLKEGVEKGLKEGVEKGLKEGVEKGLKEGVEKGLKEGVEKGLKKGVEKGLKEGIETVALNLLRRGIEHSVICEDTGLSREEVSQLEKQIGNTPEYTAAHKFPEIIFKKGFM